MKSFFKLSLLFVSLFLSLFLTSCVTTASFKGEFVSDPEIYPESALYPKEIVWEELQPGFQITSHNIKKIDVSWHCVKIDLDTPNLKIHIEPHNSAKLGLTFWVKDFAKQTNSVVAINASPFDLDGKTYLPVGIVKINDKELSVPKEKYCALGFTKQINGFKAEIIDKQTPENLVEYPTALGGFYTIFEENQILPFRKNKRSRTGCGISDDGRFLYLMVTTPFFHLRDRNGLNYEECAMIFRYLGCEKAMQFDGGHSSAMVVKGKSVETPFLQRKVPVAIGFSVE